MSESSLDEFRNYDPSKEMDIDALRTAVRGHLADDEWVMIHPKAILHILDSMEAAEKDAARYRILEKIMETAKGGASLYVNESLSYYEKPKEGEECELHWYPDTPVGYFQINGSTLKQVTDSAIDFYISSK